VKRIEVMGCDWLHRAILTDRRIAAYHLVFLKLGAIERRLYELAKFNCGNGDGFKVDMEALAARVGCATDKRALEYPRNSPAKLPRNNHCPNTSSR
jgi:hypothetical protein